MPGGGLGGEVSFGRAFASIPRILFERMIDRHFSSFTAAPVPCQAIETARLLRSDGGNDLAGGISDMVEWPGRRGPCGGGLGGKV